MSSREQRLHAARTIELYAVSPKHQRYDLENVSERGLCVHGPGLMPGTKVKFVLALPGKSKRQSAMFYLRAEVMWNAGNYSGCRLTNTNRLPLDLLRSQLIRTGDAVYRSSMDLVPALM